MVTPFGYVDGEPHLYYDTYALLTVRNKRSIRSAGRSILHVNSAFGGLAMVRSCVMEKCFWDKSETLCSEHVHFCKMVREYGNVVINRDIRVKWRCT